MPLIILGWAMIIAIVLFLTSAAALFVAILFGILCAAIWGSLRILPWVYRAASRSVVSAVIASFLSAPLLAITVGGGWGMMAYVSDSLVTGSVPKLPWLLNLAQTMYRPWGVSTHWVYHPEVPKTAFLMMLAFQLSWMILLMALILVCGTITVMELSLRWVFVSLKCGSFSPRNWPMPTPLNKQAKTNIRVAADLLGYYSFLSWGSAAVSTLSLWGHILPQKDYVPCIIGSFAGLGGITLVVAFLLIGGGTLILHPDGTPRCGPKAQPTLRELGGTEVPKDWFEEGSE